MPLTKPEEFNFKTDERLKSVPSSSHPEEPGKDFVSQLRSHGTSTETGQSVCRL